MTTNDDYIHAGYGVRSWLFTLDHKRIGVMYLCTTVFFFLLGGVFALLLRLELLTPQARYFSNHTYNVFFTLHGAMMIFLFIIPGIPAVFGNFILPIIIDPRYLVDIDTPADWEHAEWLVEQGVPDMLWPEEKK